MSSSTPNPVHSHRPPQRIRVSDRAVVRWLERNGPVDVQQLREQLATSLEKACSVAAALHAREFYVRRDGYRFVVTEGVLVTLYPDKTKPNRPRKRRPMEDEE